MALVVDASVLTELILGRAGSERAAQALADGDWHAPEHLLVEVASALRRVWLSGAMDNRGFGRSVQRLSDSAFHAWPVRPLLPRITQLARNATPYDAAYVALAESLAIPLLTADRRLRRLPGARCTFLG